MANPNFDNQFAQDSATGEKIYGNDPRVLAVQEQWKAKGVTLNADVIMGNLGAYGISPANPNPQPPQGGTMPPPAPMPQGGAAPTPAPQQGSAPKQKYNSPSEEFYGRLAGIVHESQNTGGMKDLLDARNALMSSRNKAIMQATPEELRRFPPEVQKAFQNVQAGGIDEQIRAIDSAMESRKNEMQVMRQAYTDAFAIAKEFDLTQSKTREDARQWMQMLMQAGVSPSQAEYEYLLDTGSVPDTMMPKLQKAIAAKNLLDQQKSQQGTFQSVQSKDGSMWTFNSATGKYDQATEATETGDFDFSTLGNNTPKISIDEFIAQKENAAGMSFSAAKRAQITNEYNQMGQQGNQAQELYLQLQSMMGSGGLSAVSSQDAANNHVIALLKKGEIAKVNQFLNQKAEQALTGEQKNDFSTYGAVATNAVKALSALENIEDQFDPGFWTNLIQENKPLIGLEKNPTYVDLMSQISQLQAKYANRLFGAALTVEELARANGFLIDPKKDGLGTTQIKLKNMIDFVSTNREQLLSDKRGTTVIQRPPGYYRAKNEVPNATDDEIYKALGQPITTSFSSDVGSSVNSSQLKSLTNGKTTLASLGSGTVTGIDGSSAWKPGLDFVLAGGKGAAVPSPFTGTVISSGKNGGFGNQVKIKLSSGEELWVSHLDAINVKKGQQVVAGKTILGKQGNTGTVLSGTGGKLSADQVKSGRGTHLDLTIKKANGKLMTAREVAAALGDTRLKKT